MRQVHTTIRWGGPHLWLILAATAVALGGCATEPTRYSAGPIRAHTFDFVRMSETKNPDDADKRAEAHALIQRAIERNLASKGLTRVDDNGDVDVLYMIIISDGTGTKSINDYYGNDDSAVALQDKAHEAFDIENRNPTRYDAGTLVVDIVDHQQGTVLWRNYVYRPILRDLPIEQREARLQQAVDELFKGLRVAK